MVQTSLRDSVGKFGAWSPSVRPRIGSDPLGPARAIIPNQILAERDLVAVHWTASGTNTQPGMGIPATGKKISVSGMTIFASKQERYAKSGAFGTCCPLCGRWE